MAKKITGILLAAGASTRFGGNKLLCALDDGKTIIERSALNLATVIPDLIIIYDAHNQALTQHLKTLHYTLINNPQAALGLGASIACGVKATKHSDAWLIALGDMPLIKPQSISKINQALVTGDKIVAPFYRGQRGHPVGFSRDYYSQLSSLDTDTGARDIIKDNQNDLTAIEIDDPGTCFDVDHRSDLKSTLVDALRIHHTQAKIIEKI